MNRGGEAFRNLIAEALGKLIDRCVPPDNAEASLAVLDLKPLPFTAQEAAETARLRPRTRSRGLSLGDRCLLGDGASTRQCHDKTRATSAEPMSWGVSTGKTS